LALAGTRKGTWAASNYADPPAVFASELRPLIYSLIKMWSGYFCKTHLSFDRCINHDLSVISAKKVLEAARSRAMANQKETAVGDILGPRRGHSNRIVHRSTGSDRAGLGDGLGDGGICDTGGLLLIRGTDLEKDGNLLTGPLFLSNFTIPKSLSSG